MKNHWLVLWSLWAARLVRQPTMPVRTEGGWLRGVLAPDGSHKQYLAIPYVSFAKRFQAPGPPPVWRGVFEAIEEYIRCPQRIVTNIIKGQEDCLILNVYTPPDASPSSKYPVMAYIHGGAFFEGASSNFMYGADYLVSKGIILVTFNYRLNILGYLCLKIKEATGNTGMKDQVAALKWIQRNIRSFGGDPNKVTLFGESAGAASVSLHVLSPMSKGLFHRAIMQSGSSLAPWTLQFRPVYMASLLAKTMGFPTEDPFEILNKLSEKTDEELIIPRVPRKEGNIVISELLYSACIEEKIDGEEQFLTDLPYNLLSKGEYNKVPVMIGSNSEEGLFLAAMENDTTIPKITFEKSLPRDVAIPNDSIRKEIADKLQTFYMDGRNFSYDSLGNLSRLHGEVHIIYPILQETEFYLETNHWPVYSYVFNYDGWRNLPKLTLIPKGLWSYPGATHADDVFYLFKQPLLPSLFEDTMINRMTTMWTNFAKYGDPIPEPSDLLPLKWHPATKSSPRSLVIDAEFSTVPLYTRESLKYLREVYSKYRRKGD